VHRLATFAVAGAAVVLTGSLFLTTSSAQIQNPIKAARDAYNKAKKDAQKQQQKQTPRQTSAGTAPATAADSAPAAGGVAAPWTPPKEGDAPVEVDFSKTPDVIGIRFGMTPQEALATMRKQYPQDLYGKMTDTAWPDANKPDFGYNILSSAPGNQPDAYLSFTAPPNPQVVWRVTRFTRRMHINHDTFLAALREKYGKETYAGTGNARTTDDRQIGQLYWLFDEKGGRVPLPPDAAFPGGNSIIECMYDNTTMGNPQPQMPTDDVELLRTNLGRGWCSNFVGVHVSLDEQEIVENAFTEMLDVPLALRTAHAAAVWQADLAERLRREDLERSKKSKPVL